MYGQIISWGFLGENWKREREKERERRERERERERERFIWDHQYHSNIQILEKLQIQC